MNPWLKLSIEYANQRSYLDDLFKVYPTIPEWIRDINKKIWSNVESAYQNQDNAKLIKHLIELDLFPIKDSYVAYLKRDKNSISRNPATINRICGRIYEMWIDKVYENCSEAKETNRQMGPAFRNWLRKKSLGIEPIKLNDFLSSNNNAILDEWDAGMMRFAQEHLWYERNKGLDFIGRFNGKYVVWEAKFLTDFWWHQNAQFEDAISTLYTPNLKAIPIAILDGILYIHGGNKLHKSITEKYSDANIMSSLVLREFLYQI